MQDERIRFDDTNGASAGAVNAVALAHGFALPTQKCNEAINPREAARACLAKIWHGVEAMGRMDAMAAIDFEAIAHLQSPKVFVSATHVTTGQADIFSGKRLGLQAVMTSTCLPTVFKAVEIDGKSYWDGGFLSNPVLLPLINQCSSCDIMVVQINPLRRPSAPHTPQDIMDRANELTFNASLLSQMRSIDFINRMLSDGRLTKGLKYKHMRLHRIDGGEALESLPASSKMSEDSAMIEKLIDIGQSAAKRWLQRHFDALGQEGMVDIRHDYIGRVPPDF